MTSSWSRMEPTVELSVVIPAYRSAESVGELSDRLVAVLDKMGRSYEILFIDDDSPDETWQALCGVRERHGKRIVLIRLASNGGQHNALMCGFRHVRGKLIITMDDDLQCKPEVVPELVDKLESERLDLVYGNYPIHGHSIFRTIAVAPIRVFVLVVFGLSIPPTSVRVVRRDLIDSILYYRGPFTVVDGLLCWNTRRVGGMPVERTRREKGRSTYTFPKLVLLAFNVFTNFSVLPLRLISLLGGILTTAGSLVAMGAAFQVLVPAEPHWLAPISAMMLILAGIQLLSLGLLGEYLGRILISINGKPQHLIRTAIGLQDHESDTGLAGSGASRKGAGTAEKGVRTVLT